jgi:hypothetical protein
MRSFTNGAVHGYVARVLLNDTVGDGQTEARAASSSPFGREEQIVDALDIFLTDTLPRIRDLGRYLGSRTVGRPKREPTTGGHGLLGIQNQVQKDLL